MERNTLYYGDCLDVRCQWDDNTVDIITVRRKICGRRHRLHRSKWG